MRLIRLLTAVLLAAGLSVVPVSAAMAKAMTHANRVEMGMASSGDTCPCCNPANTCMPDDC